MEDGAVDMKTLILALILSIGVTTNCYAYSSAVHKVEDSMPLDKWAHMGAGYVISNELKKHTKLTFVERTLVVGGLAYAKERWADKEFNRGDMWATISGAVALEVKF